MVQSNGDGKVDLPFLADDDVAFVAGSPCVVLRLVPVVVLLVDPGAVRVDARLKVGTPVLDSQSGHRRQYSRGRSKYG